jgi:hypothetical protein
MNKMARSDHRFAEFGLDSVHGGASPSIFCLAPGMGLSLLESYIGGEKE